MKGKTLSQIRFKTRNCGGIGGQTKDIVNKRRGIFNSISHGTDITILTETKFKKSDLAIYKREWGSGMLVSCTPELRGQAGVAILFRKGLAVSFPEGGNGTDQNGRVVWTLAEINTKILLIIGVYAPSQGDEPKFFKDEVFPILDKVDYDHVVIGGDWNLGMDGDLDYYGYANNDPVRPKSRHELHKNIEHYELLDIYRELHPTGSEKTWRTWNKSRRKADKEARLDYFIVDTGLASFVQLVGVSAPFTTAFDHRPVILNLDFNKVNRGPGYWKFNNCMLEEPEFINMVREQIAFVLMEYQALETPESTPLTTRQIYMMTPMQQAEIPLSINPHQFLEFLLFAIKGVARKYGKKKKANLIAKKEQAEEQLRAQTKVYDVLLSKIRSGPQSGDTEEAYIVTKGKITYIQKEIHDIETHLCEGAYIRCGSRWKCESEAPTKVFFQQEKWRGQQRFMGIIEVDGEEPDTVRQIINQPEIESEIRTFYANLYRERPTASSDADLQGFMGEVGYNKFQNIAKKQCSPTLYENLSKDISSDEVLQAIMHGRHGVAPGISGFSREFYQMFREDLIGFIMLYIKFSEDTGILSDNQRVGVITLIPKGTKDKKSLKNWRPITLLSTLYKVISGVIGNRFKKCLPAIIGPGQEGFVDGRYMGEVTRLLYDTIHDAYSTKGKTGVIMSIDFEKAFDSVSFSFMEKVIETAGFPKILQTWVKILLKGFRSHINHAGNLLKLIELGRGARQGDPIASILFVLAIEILLIAIRNNPNIEPYRYEALSAVDTPISNKVGAYADDVNIMMPRSEASIRETISTLDRFEILAGLRVNKDKTQMLRIGKGATSAPILCEDLGLKWVTRMKILGINLSANPDEMLENFDEKISEIETLLNNFSYRNITVYGRVRVVKALALSKVTHLVQIIPSPPLPKIRKLQRVLNKFIWSGPGQKKTVIRQELAEQPPNRGGLGIPNLENFWDSLKLAWLSRLFQSRDDCTWKKLAMSRISFSLRIPHLTTNKLLGLGPESIATAAKSISNPFWKVILAKLPQLERTFYTMSKSTIGERIIWDNSDFLHEGKPLSKKGSGNELHKHFNTVISFISPKTHVLMSEEEASNLLEGKHLQGWRNAVSSTAQYLLLNNVSWLSLSEPVFGPMHMGWSRLVSENFKSKKYYNLLMTRPPDHPRNPNEKVWLNKGLTTFGPDRFDKIYRNLSKLRCNLRVKYEELRVIWGRQELNRYKSLYANLPGGNSTLCSYCGREEETELHLYVECGTTGEFMVYARNWFARIFGETPSLMLKGPRLFGLENEPPDDLSNIFYRSARYTIYSNRKRACIPSMKYFAALVRDELKLKFKGTRILSKVKTPSDQTALDWLRIQMGWTVGNHIGHPTINPYPSQV